MGYSPRGPKSQTQLSNFTFTFSRPQRASSTIISDDGIAEVTDITPVQNFISIKFKQCLLYFESLHYAELCETCITYLTSLVFTRTLQIEVFNIHFLHT